VAAYVYIRTQDDLWTVGFYTPSGKWQAESDHDEPEKAAERVAWLNGTNIRDLPARRRPTALNPA
jgi:hypothetical protein